MLDKLLKDKILAAVTLESSQDALFVAEALLKGGLNVMEVPLRTEEALKAIALIKTGNVIAAGGSWMVNKELIKNKEFKAIEENVRALIKISHG